MTKVEEMEVSQLEAGMRLASDVYWQGNIPYLLKDTVLSEYLIERLILIGKDNVLVYGEDSATIKSNLQQYDRETQAFADTYDKSLDCINQAFAQVRSGHPPDVKKIKASAREVVSRIMDNNNILGRLRLVKTKDEYTYKHSVNVAMLAAIIGKWLSLSDKDVYNLGCAGMLHDIGKTQIPDEILNKPGKLSDNEYIQMKHHTTSGYGILKTIPDLDEGIMLAALCHHERYDGSGYPLRIKGPATHLYPRIIAVADIYDAMTSDRVYRSKVSPFKVAEQIAESSFGELDPNVSHTFLKNIYAFYIGNVVRLNNDVVGEIIYVNPQYPTRPVVRTQDSFIDLLQEKHLEVEEVLA